MSISRKFQRSKSKYTLSQKIISAVTAAGFIMQPIVGFAQSINKINNNGSIEVKGNVTHIWADKVVSNAAVNVFKDFQLDANNIANMYFNTKGASGADVANLVNFVNSRIDINGTVNAVKDNKIGGNLFFLSKDGMAVGKSGVINTGSLYVMTPATGIDINSTAEDYNYTFEGLKGAFNNGIADDTTLDRMKMLNIPLNADGTISVLGTINAVADVKMAAPKIAVGKNISGEDLKDGENGAVGTKAGGIVKTAVIRTGNSTDFNFADLVNIKDADGNIVTKAGLDENLTAVASGNGDIVLAAKAEYGNAKDQDFNNLGSTLGIPVNLNDETTIEASVENYGTIDAMGDAVLTAEATNGNKDWAEATLEQNTPNGVNNPDYVPVPAADAGNYIQTIASVNVQGDVTAGGNIEIKADSDNTYVDSGKGIVDSFMNSAIGIVNPMGANVMILKNEANVTVGIDADITAGKAIDVQANAVLDATLGEAVSGRKLIKKVPDAIPAASVGYADVENNAAVTIEGRLTADGANSNITDEDGNVVVKPAVNVSAYAEENLSNNVSLNLSSGMLGAGTSALAAAVAVSESSNNAEVNVNGVITADNGDANIKADTFNLLTANASTTAPDDSVGATAVNVITHNGEANIAVNGDITAQNVNIDATNYTDENTITANNALGMGKFKANLMNAVNVNGIVGALKENPLVQKITNKDGEETPADKPGLFKQLSEKLAVSAAVVVADENNSANVTFGKTADVTATNGSINADADVNIFDSHLYASGTANSYKKTESGTTDTVTVGAGVVYSGMENNASVVFAEGEAAAGDENKATLTAAKDINITSSTKIEYHRPERIKRGIDRSIENLNYAIEAIKNLPEYTESKYKDVIDGLSSLKDSLEGYAENYSTEFIDGVSKPDAITADGTMNTIFDAAAGAAVIYNDVMELQQNFNDMLDVTSPFTEVISNALGVVSNAVAFADPNNYANVAASASAKGGTESTKFALSGSVTVTDYNNNSSVNVGKFTQLNAGEKLNLNSANKVEDVNITGKTQFWKPGAEAKGGLGIGGSVNYQNFDTDSKVVVEEGANLSAGDISIGSNSDIFHVGAMLGAGKSDGSAVNGMVTITDSDSYNNVIVDTNAVLQAVKSAANQGSINIGATNNTSVTNAIISVSASGANVGAGIGVALNNIDVQNTAQIVDNDGTEGEDDELTGSISASDLNVNAETTGLINTVSVAGGVTSSGENEGENESGGFFDSVKTPFNKIADAQEQILGGISKVSNKLQDVLRTMDLNSSGESSVSGKEVAGTPSFSFAGAGSVSLNLVDDTTKAVIDGANIKLDNDGTLVVGARDSAFTGAWSGSAGMSFRKGNQSATSVAVSGAVGVNDIDNEITALVKDSTVSGAKDVDVAAVSGGTTVAAGIGATLTSDKGQAKSYSGGASVSVNLIDKTVNSNMEGVRLTDDAANKANVDVAAYESDVQVTGGVNANIATGGGSLVGGGVTVADINNKINAGISGGNYTNVNNIKVKGLLAVTQVTAAVSAGVAAGNGNAFSGAVVYNGLSNDLNAGIDGAAITADGLVNVTAKDTKSRSTEAEPYQTLLGDYSNHNTFAADRGIDTTGSSYYTDLDTNGEAINYSDSEGSTIVGAAFVVAGGKDSAGGAAVNIADIDNDFKASIDNSTIKAGSVSTEADADTLLVGAAGGVAAGATSFGGMGSVSWQNIDNDITSEIINSEITTNSVTAKAVNKTQAVNVAGSVSVGKSAAVGATLAYNALDNTVGAYMRGNTISAWDGGNVDVIVNADNTGKVYGIGAGVSASTKVAINGSVAVNRGGSNTEAIIDKSKDDKNEEKESKIIDAGSVNVTADDKTYRLAVVGQVSASGKAAVGGGVAYNDIGGSSAGSGSSSQNTTAAIKNTDITMAANSEKTVAADGEKTVGVNVAANDSSELNTIAVGVAAAPTAGVQGSAATALINKNVTAEIENTDIENTDIDNNNVSKNANVIVDAQNDSSITTSADTASVAGQGAGVGAGVAVNRIIQQTNAAVNGGTMNVNNLTVNANGTPSIENIGIGIAVAGQGAGVTGSVSVNMIDNDVTTHIGSGANITADGSVGVVATSDEQIANYAGQAAVAGQGAGVGVSVAVNQIAGTTSATVGGKDEAKTSVTAKGKSSLNTNTFIRGYEYGYENKDETKNSQINNALISQDTVSMNTTINRESENRSGLVVDASSTRDMKSFLLTAGVGGMGAGVTGTVNVNMIKGATNAGVANTIVNGGSASTAGAGNVFVNAGDYTNMSGFVGSGGVGGIGAGVGLGSDTNTFSRNVEAVVENSDIKAKALEVDADSQQGVSSFAVGAGIADVGGGVAGIVTVTELENATKAALLNSNVNANTVNINANHTGVVNAGNVSAGVGGVGAGVGISVGVLKDNSSTEVTVGDDENAKTQGSTNITAANDVNIAAENTAVVKPMISATGGAGVGAAVAGATSVNNLNSVVKTNVNNAVITSNNGNINGTANNTFNVEAYSGGNAIGGAGIGVGANVTVNTIDSTVQTNVNDSTLNAETGNVTLTADEDRNIEQLATNIAAGGIAAGANIAITSVGEAIGNEDSEKISNKSDNYKEANDAAADKIKEANNAYGANDTKTLLGDSAGALGTACIDDIKLSVGAGYGGLEDENGNKISQITVNITNSDISAAGSVTADAAENDNISMTLGSGAAGAAAVNAGVGILNVHRNVGVNITGGSIDAGTVDIGTDITGEAKLDVYQGSAGVIGANAAVGIVNTTGSSKIKISGAELTGNNINILAADHGVTKANTLGITIGAVSVGVITAEADNTGATNVVITDTEANAKDSGQESSISIGTDKANTVEAHATGGAGGSVAAQGVVATAEDSGVSSITLGEADGSAGNTFTVNNITVQAAAKPVVKAIADSFAVSIFGTAGASVATANAAGTVTVNVYNGNTLAGDDVDISAEAVTQNGQNTAEAQVVGNSGSGYYTFANNNATANVTTNVDVNVGDVDYKTTTEQIFVGYKDVGDGTTGEREEDYEEVTAGATNLNISGSNTAKASANAKGITIGGIFSSGNNQAITNNEAVTNVTLNSGSGSEGTLLNSLNVTAAGTSDNTAKADGSGGGLISADLAAYAENNSEADVNVNVSGTLEVEGDIAVNALQNDTVNLNADALKATVVGLSATAADNNISGTTNVNISNADINGGGKFDVSAANNITFGNTEKYAVEGSGYGGVNVQGVAFTNNIDKNTAINLNDADIITLGTQALEAKTTGNINAGGYIKAAGLGAFTWVDVNNAVTASDTINVDGSSSLTTKQEGADITLAAVDNMDLTVAGYADVQGAAVGGASSDVTNNLVRNNSVTVSGDLYALNDVNLYAGKDKTGANGSLDLVAESETYNYAALPIADPKLDDKFAQNNQIIINSGSDISSVRDINLYADAGKESVRDTTLMYTWVYSDKKENYSNSSVGYAKPNNKTAQNFVQVDGNLTAGVQNKQYVSIGGKYNAETQETNGMQLVFFDDETLKAVHDYGNGQESAVGADGLIVDYSEGVDGNGIEIGTFDYGTTLFDRYNELGELMAGYSEDTSSTAYLGYKAERQRIFEQLQSMNLIKEMTNDKGQKYYVQVEGMTVDYIELPDIVASGGNINIQSDSLSGSGGLTAQGAPEVVINNNTNLYLKVNNVTVGEAGGEVNFNNTALTSADGTKYGGITIAPDKESGSGGELVINGNYGGGYVYAQVDLPKDQDSTQSVQQTIQLKPRADIEINGIVNSEEGTVRITSAADNIVIQGESAADSAAVKGKTIVLSASKGSVSQGFQEGIVNIGGSVQTQYDDLYQDAKDHFDNKYEFKHDSVEDEWSTNDTANEPSGNMIAGENVYINASDINVNGKIQSGYADYVVNIDAGLQKTINQMQQNWQNSGSKPLTDAMVTTGTTYRIVEGKDILQSDGTYYRQLDVYYNPYTGQIVVPDVDANGGQVYLTGRISSTGSGSIKVLDGAYDINVTNNTSTDLQLGKLVSNNVDGLISIADTGTKKVTEFTRNGTVVKDMTRLDENGNYIVVSESGASSQYQPDTNLRYNWTTGQETTTSETYHNTIKAGLWGLVETMDEDELVDFEESHKPVEPATETNKNKPNGEYIGSVEGVGKNDDNFVVIYENDKFEENRTQPVKIDSWSSGFLGWFKWEKYEWEVTTGTSQQYVASVNAGKPISIGFIGNSEGNSNIGVTSAGNINLTNNIASASGGTGSLIDISSTGGAINQLGGSLIGDNIDLSAAKGINDVQITSIGDTVNLNAVSSNGDVDVTVNAAYGKAGNVVIDNLFAGTAANPAGDVSLTAYGNITQSDTDTFVSGNRIDLVSANGAIGTDKQAIIVHGGQEIVDATDSLSASVNAQAKGNINLTQDSGDMRIGRVYSDSGNVTITVNSGDLIDALPSGETVDRGDTDELIQKWIDLGLVEGTGDYSKKVEQDIADYKEGVKDEFENYLAQENYYESQTGSVTQEYKDAYNAYSEAKTQYDALKSDYDTWTKGKIYYTDDAYVPNEDNYRTEAEYQTALTEYNAGKATFEELNAKFNGTESFSDYVADNTGDTYAAYLNPSVTITDSEGKSQIVDLKAEFDGYANYESLKSTYGRYESVDAYLAGSEAQTHIAELSDSGKTYWDKDRLLYAISDTITNPGSGSTDNVVKDPNIKGNNITVNVKGGSAGLNSEKVTKLEVAGIGDNIENLKLLASADASTVNWDNKTGIITINEKLPIGIQSTGKVDVETNGNVYLSGRTESGPDDGQNILNIGNINAGTDGNIRLQGQDGIYNLSASDRAAITGKDLLIQAGEGSIGKDNAMMTTNLSGSMQAQASGGIYINQLGTNNLVLDSVGAGQDIVLKSANDILMSTDMQSGGAVNYIRSDNGTITLEAQNIGAKDNALRILNNGVVVNAKANKENGDIILAGVTGTGLDGELVLGAIEGANLDVTSAGNVSIGKDASEDETPVEGSIEVNGDASISAEDGSVTQTADSNITANAVNASATENILLNSKKNKVNSFIVNGIGTGNSINGSVELAGSKDSGFTADLNGITVNNGGVTVTNYAENGTLNISGGSVTTTDAEKGSVTFSSEGSITSDATVNSAANINMNADGAIDNDGSLTAQNNVNVDTTAGAIELGGSVTANTGTVTVHSDKGAIHIGDDNGNGTVNAGTDVSITTNEGNITTTGAVSGGSNVKVDAGTKGNIELGGIVNAEGGSVDVDTHSGDVTTKGEVTGKIDVTINSDDGDITIGGKVQSETGSTHINAGTEEDPGITEDKDGNVTVNGEVASGKEVIVNANNGSITVTGNTTASDGNVQTTVKGNGNISLEGSVNASGNVKAEVTGTGDITTSDNAEVNSTDIEFTANKGNITTGSSLTAKENVDLNTNTGDITFGGDVTASDGNITININEAGNLKDVLNTENTLSAFSQDGDDAKGNIYINIKGIGDVDLSEIYADNDARLDIANGNLALGTINGELVAIQLRTEDKDMNVGEIIAGTQIVLTGSDMTLDQIAQRPDADGMLVITPDNAEADKPIDNFTIGDIKTNSDSGIRFDRLWVNNSDIHISEGQLWFDKLYVEDNAHFSNDEMTAAIYGKPPLRDGSDSVYWINTEENRPESSLDMWLNGTGDWMYLRFTDDHIQESNGILLTLDEYDYVYNQRFTAENHLRWQHGRYLDEDWKQAYGYGLSLHNRYGLIDYQEFTETNAGADGVAVEA
ncbi:hypothetical protein M3079_04615 [Phascolarctobacterium sp. ET69]|uniref:hypothetical protein n=1 Tax=Phascolarctobacterium sp. ET69 TaxID=2939420 RepID=UPI002011F2C7|nr:hypothetical protein [Phascolarctobacterium sp. ET69]MCL1605271.1 hypothetical protein [Phascolarctobacterium sp. ET69]